VDRLISAVAGARSLAATSLRYFNVAGASGRFGEDHHPETHLIPAALQVAAGVRDSVPVYGTDHGTPDGTAVRDFVHVGDAARACVLALESTAEPGQRICNIGSGRGHSVRARLQSAQLISGYPIPTTDSGRRPGDVPVLLASVDRARLELGWTPQHPDLDGMVRDSWTFLRSHLGCRADLGSLVIA